MRHFMHENPIIEEFGRRDVATHRDAISAAGAPNVVPWRTPPPPVDDTRMRNSETGKCP